MNGNWRSAWRLITLALLVAVGVLTLAATTWAEDEIKVYAWWNNDPVFAEVFARFERDHPNVKVTEVASSGYDGLLTMIAGGTPPDVAIMPIGYYMPFADVGALADISATVEKDAEFQALRSDLFLNILSEFVTPSGALYAFPIDINLRMLFYNRDHFNEAGVAFPTSDWDFERFVQSARDLTRVDGAGNVIRWGFEGFSGPPSSWVTWVRAGGGRLADSSINPTRFLLSEPQAREALQRLSDLINVYHAAPPQGVSFGSMLPSMGLPWIETTFNLENIDGLDYAMVPQPSGDERYSAMGVRLVGVVKGSEQERLAYELAKYMSTDLEAQRLLAVRKVSWVRSIATDPDYLETPPGRNKQSVVEAIQHAEPIYPLTSHWAELEPLLQAHVLPALRAEVPVETATAEVDRIVATILSGE